MASIVFTQIGTGVSSSLLGAIVTTRRINGIESSPDKNFNTVKIARRDGEKKVSDDYAPRKITIEGSFNSPDATAFRTNMDAYKRDVSGPGYLDVTFDGANTRRYYVEVQNWVFTNDHYTLTTIPFALNLIAMDPPFGEDINSTPLYSATDTNAAVNQTSTLGGSAEPAVDLQITMKDPGTLEAIEVKNTTTATSTTVYAPFTRNDVLQIKTAQPFVGLNGQPVKFDGNVVRFDPGQNNWLINYTTSDSYVLSDGQLMQNSDKMIFGTICMAQKIQVTSSMVIGRLDLMLSKTGTPPTPQVRIYAGNILDPTSTPLATQSSVTSPISEAASFIPVEFPSNVTLAAGYYWIVVACGTGAAMGSGDINNGYLWKGSTLNPYAAGNAARCEIITNTVINYPTYDFAFRLYEAQVGDSFALADGDTINETFTSITYRDFDNTSKYGDGSSVWTTAGNIWESTGV